MSCISPACFGGQVTLEAIGISLRALVHVFNLFLIVFTVFALSGVSLYQKAFQRRCVLPQGTLADTPKPIRPLLHGWLLHHCS